MLDPEVIPDVETADGASEPAAALTVLDPDLALTDEMSASAWLQTLADAQRAILNSQQANRDLIGVVIQDNFNLKAENHKLRDRMLALERDLTELRRRDEARREAVEARLQAVEAAVNTLLDQLQRVQVRMRPPVTQPTKDPASHRGFWARLLGD